MKPEQARYIKFIIGDDGRRGRGEAGASKKHVWAPGQKAGTKLGSDYTDQPRLSRYGGVADGESKRLFAEMQGFKARASASVRRMSKAGFAMTLRKAGKTTGVAAYSKGGVFYGTVDGKTGFWARPKRTAPFTGKKLLGTLETLFGRSFALKQRDSALRPRWPPRAARPGELRDETGRPDVFGFQRLEFGDAKTSYVPRSIPLSESSAVQSRTHRRHPCPSA